MSRRDVALLHARTAGFRRRVDTARRLVDAWATQCSGRVAVAFSGGKDSSVVLHLVRSVVPGAVALHGDDEWLLPETAALLDATPNLVRLVRPLQHTDWFTAWEGVPGPNGGSKDRWCHDHGITGEAIGLRAEENSRRRIHLRACGTSYLDAGGLLKLNPIAWWSTRDVWAYLHSEGVPYNAAYDVLERIGVPPERQRIGPLATERALGYGQIAILKRGWPDVFNRFAAAHPEARAYA